MIKEFSPLNISDNEIYLFAIVLCIQKLFMLAGIYIVNRGLYLLSIVNAAPDLYLNGFLDHLVDLILPDTRSLFNRQPGTWRRYKWAWLWCWQWQLWPGHRFASWQPRDGSGGGRSSSSQQRGGSCIGGGAACRAAAHQCQQNGRTRYGGCGWRTRLGWRQWTQISMQNVPAGELHTRLPNAVAVAVVAAAAAAAAAIVCTALSRKLRPEALYVIYV